MSEITLSSTEYRRADFRLSRWRRYGNCVRHPIHAFMAYQAVNPDPPESAARQQALLWTAMAHGFAAWAISQNH